MRENEFEKRVQEKMEDFDLSPSASVWPELELRIRKEKKRRFIFWWPLFFLLVGGGIAAGILLSNKKGKKETITVNNNAQLTDPLLPGTTNAPTADGDNKTIIPNETFSKKDTAVVTAKNNDKTKTAEKEIIITPKSGNKPTEKKIIIIKEQKVNEKVKSEDNDIVTTGKPGKDQIQQPPVTIPSKPVTTSLDPVKTNDIAVVRKQEPQQKDQQPIINSVPSKQNDQGWDPDKKDTASPSPPGGEGRGEVTVMSKQEKPQENTVQVPVQPLVDSIAIQQKTSNAKKKTRKWDWGMSFSAGRSSVADGLNFSNRLLFADAMSPQISTGSPFSAASASPIRPCLSWATGLFIRQSISKKLDLKIGVGYSYLSTKINTGNRVDSAKTISNSRSVALTVNNFYRSGGTSSYTNRYHFISLSANLSWRIINGKHFKLDWENGLSYDRLIGSNMLHYDRTLPGYYQDNNLLTKNHLFFSTGLSVPAGKRVMIDPFASYSLTRVLKNTDSSMAHYTNYGIRIRFLLHKK